jgi:hypothetical protein
MQERNKDFSTLYDEATLSYWQTRYPDNVRWNFENLLLQKMTPDERRTLDDTRLEFPLVAGEDMRDVPFAFYAFPSLRTITLPILSIKFLDDMSIASAWLECNGFSQETIMDYMSMLKYADPAGFDGGCFPPPLQALRIPDDALDDPNVDDLSQKILKSALLWILAHEVGHLRFQHQGYEGVSAEEAQQNEIDADGFATEMFRRIGVVPGGMVMLFMLFGHFLPHRGDFGSDGAWQSYVSGHATHPMSASRLQALADGMRVAPKDFAAAEPNQAAATSGVRFIVQNLETIAKLSGDMGQQMFWRVRGVTVTPRSLGPRRPGETVVSSLHQMQGDSENLVFHGVYTGAHVRRLAKGGTESLDVCLIVDRNGDRATGRFSFGIGEGALQGRAVGDDLHFEWQWGDTYGRGVLKATAPDAFTGIWGYEDSRDDGGSWSGTRVN